LAACLSSCTACDGPKHADAGDDFFEYGHLALPSASFFPR
jgi:hypothetical protein